MTESTDLLNIRPLRRRLKEGKEALGMWLGITDPLAVEAIAYYGVPFDRDVLAFGANTAPIGPDYSTNTAGRYFNLRKASIYGGSNEIQRNIMAKLILGL